MAVGCAVPSRHWAGALRRDGRNDGSPVASSLAAKARPITKTLSTLCKPRQQARGQPGARLVNCMRRLAFC